MNEPEQSRSARFPGFDSVRLLAAASVMFSHAYMIAQGNDYSEPFVRLLGSDNIIGLYGVFAFFIISGFLLSRSLSANPDPLQFALSRVCRIAPAFVFCTVVTAFVIGPWFTSLPAREYFSRNETYVFLKESINRFNSMPLPGVFSYDPGKLAQTVNGSLWSLQYEILSYVFLLLLFSAVRRISVLTGAMVLFTVATMLSTKAADLVPGIAYTLPYFCGGAVMNWIAGRFRLHWLVAAMSAVGLVISAALGVQKTAFALFGAYLVVFAGLRPNPFSRLTQAIGDCSYGLYLFGWPAEQMVKQWTKTTDPLILFGLALPLAFGCAFISCHVIELPALRFRKTAALRARAWIRTLLPQDPRTRRAALGGAKLGFITTTAVILVSRSAWYYIVEAMAGILVVTIASSALAAFAAHVGTGRSPGIKTLGPAPG